MLGASPLGSEPLGAPESAATTGVNVTQAVVVATSAGASSEVRASQVNVVAAYNIPAEELRSTQASVMIPYSANKEIRTTQASVLAVVKGTVDNPKLRAWAYTLDGHDYYVLKLGTGGKSLVFDLSTGQWSWWASNGNMGWRASLGMNWRSAGSIPLDYGSNVIVGDDSYGVLWTLDPEQPNDDALLDETQVSFNRVAMGQVPMRGRGRIPVFSAYLTASTGDPAITGEAVTLEYSDDQGRTFVTASAPVAVESGNYNQEYVWRSLGLIQAPGRLFRITDDGAFARIDSMDVND